MTIARADKPSPMLTKPSADLLQNLQLISEVFEKIEKETAKVAELLFDYLIEATDEEIMTGTIPGHKNKKIDGYIKILNRLFAFSRKGGGHAKVGLRIINRKTIEDLDRKTFMICMCFDGGASLDVLCDVVNTENSARMPKNSPIKVTVKKAFGGLEASRVI
jgi:hypothetical protein